MDPNATLKRIRELVRFIQNNPGYRTHAEAYELAENVEALDKWIRDDGFPPDDWANEKG